MCNNGESTINKTRLYEWYKRFQDSWRWSPSTSRTDENVKRVKEMVMYDHQNTIGEVTDDVDISIGSYLETFSNILGMKHVATKFVEFWTKTAANVRCSLVTKCNATMMQNYWNVL